MLKTFHICDGKLRDCADDKGNVLVYIDPGEAERALLIERYRLDEHTLHSALDPDEISRLEFEPEHVAIIFKRPRNYSEEDQFEFKVSSMGIFLFQDRCIFVMPEDGELFEGKPFQKVGSLPDLVLRFILRTIYHYLGHLRTINLIADSLEQKINKAMENRYLLNLFSLEKGMVYYQNAIHSNGVVIDKLKNAAGEDRLHPREPRAAGRHHHREPAVLQAGRDLLQHLRQPDGRPRLHRQQQPQRAHQDAEHRHHRHHGAHLRGQRLLHERADSPCRGTPWPSGSSWAWPAPPWRCSCWSGGCSPAPGNQSTRRDGGRAAVCHPQRIRPGR